MLETVLIILFVAIPAIILHECAHGWVAYRLGDPTAKLLGRLTLNPLNHVDLIGTIIVPIGLYLVHALGWTHSLILFGWAKPVPINFARLRNPKSDMIWVAAAGPGVNILLAFFLRLVASLPGIPYLIEQFIVWGVMLNISLAVFNMIPIPPLDGSRVVTGLLPDGLAKRYNALEPFGVIIVLVLLNIGALNFLDVVVNAFMYLIGIRPY